MEIIDTLEALLIPLDNIIQVPSDSWWYILILPTIIIGMLYILYKTTDWKEAFRDDSDEWKIDNNDTAEPPDKFFFITVGMFLVLTISVCSLSMYNTSIIQPRKCIERYNQIFNDSKYNQKCIVGLNEIPIIVESCRCYNKTGGGIFFNKKEFIPIKLTELYANGETIQEPKPLPKKWI